MPILLLLLTVVGLFLSGCGRQEVATDPSKYPAEVLQKELQVCEKTCKVTAEQGMMSSAAPNKAELISRFKPKMEVYCAQSCECLFERIQKKVKYDEFRAFEKDMVTPGKKPSPLVNNALIEESKMCAEEAKPLLMAK